MPIKHIVQAKADKYAQGMFLRQEQYALRVKSRYDYAVARLLELARKVKNEVGDRAFRFTDYPSTRDEATLIIRQLYSQVYSEIKNGVEAEWEYANLSCDGLVQSVFGKQCIDNDLFAQYFERNREAMEQFFKRKSNLRDGLGLSERVWKYSGDLRTELENAITVSLGEGVSAATMSRRVRQYLQEPEKLFRRVRGADGKLHLSKAAKAFHPGQGVYRSSYKNAMRLTRTETNAAYRLADEDRWGKMDFVVGIEIKKSARHGVADTDICDELCGKYPKDFKFSAWHPQCRCYVTPVLCTPEEMARMQRNILSGNADANIDFHSANEVTAPPKVFTDWVKNNQERIVRAKSLPYFLRDNGKITGTTYRPTFGGYEKNTIGGGSPSLIFARSEMRRKIENELKLLKGEPMTVLEADRQNANPHVLDDAAYQNNCSATSAAFVLRLLGYNIQAAPCTIGSRVDDFAEGRDLWYKLWKRADGSQPMPVSAKEWLKAKGRSEFRGVDYINFYDEACNKEGFYIASVGWKNGGGHFTVLHRNKEGKLYRIEPQWDNSAGAPYEHLDLFEMCARGVKRPHISRGVLKVDELVFDTSGRNLEMFVNERH